MINQVYEFNQQILKIAPRELGFMSKAESDHLIKALNEETQEFQEAVDAGDFIGAIDALNDLVYFAIGGLYKMGIKESLARDIFSAIHTANMTKKKGVVPKRGDGTAADAIKPADWVSPEVRISKLIDVHMTEE